MGHGHIGGLLAMTRAREPCLLSLVSDEPSGTHGLGVLRVGASAAPSVLRTNGYNPHSRRHGERYLLETIAVDLMGGDKAPEAVLKGVLEAVAEQEVTIALVGTPQALAEYERASHSTQKGSKAAGGRSLGRVTPYEAGQVVTMDESPADAWRNKKDSSIAVGIQLVKDGKASAFVSAGNSGAVAAASLLILDTMDGIDRPAIATLYRTKKSTMSLLLDVGANVDCRPAFLLQFGQMGSEYMTKVLGVKSPRVALLSNGEEDSKGTKLVKDAHKLLKESNLNFIGNVEGFDLVEGVADVVVTDGFTGNVVLKLAEALTTSIFMSLREALGKNTLARATKLLWGPPIRQVARQWYQTDIRGAPLLGVNGNIVITHGRSEAGEIKGAITLAQRMSRESWSTPRTGSTSKYMRTVSE